MEKEREEKLDEIRIKIADVIIKLNLIEKQVKEAIFYYTKTEKFFFVQEVLLNNHVISFSNKVKVLQYITREEKMEVSKDFYKSLKIMMTKRNALAHSDTVLDDFTVDDVDVDWNPDGVLYFPIYVEAEPVVTVFQEDINFETVEKIIKDFDKHHKIVHDELAEISQAIRIKFNSLNYP